MQPFDLLYSPTAGVNLIEAGAGTGKTFTIAGLFLRLVVEKGLGVDQILAVTFTRAATEELKDRVRTRLVEAREAFLAAGSREPLIEKLLRSCEPSQALERIRNALIDFDRAQIFTIHGFCQRLLFEHAFETAGLFDMELVTDQNRLMRSVSDDFWRKTIYPAPPEFVGFCMSRSVRADDLLSLIGRVKSPDVRIVPENESGRDDGDLRFAHLDSFRSLLGRLRDLWPRSREQVAQQLKSPSLSGTSYGGMGTGGSKGEVGGASKRMLMVTSLIGAMDGFLDEKSIGFPLFESFERFTAAKLKNSTKKGCRTPEHDVFDLCDELMAVAGQLESEMIDALPALKRGCIGFARRELFLRKQQGGVVFFDDLLTLVHRALNGNGGKRLVAAVQERYKAALVDEFQDTDPVQYEIFSTLFSSDDSILFMIGDPKQAIYSFRGADIFSYMKAARHASFRHTLTQNRRSHPKLIRAVNTLFSSAHCPFVFDEIGFEPAVSGRPDDFNPADSEAGLTLWFLESGPDSAKPVTKTDAEPLICRAVADEICRLIQPGDRSVSAGDIAVLVRTNAQAAMVRDEMLRRAVPCVVCSSENVLDTHEAAEMERLLAGISEPADARLIRAALVTDMMGVRGDQLAAIGEDSRWWEHRYADFRQYRDLWNRCGFIRMFRLLMARENVKSRLLGFSDGERRLTNVLHLSEIFHRQCTERHLGITGLIKWIRDQRDPAAVRSEEHQLRLESDEFAVKIVTIHKSKGLEYPVVFCPFAWQGSEINDKEILFHDREQDLKLTCDLGSADLEKHRAAAQNELLAENIRLLYVALTRAVSRCYLVWGRIAPARTSALTYLLYSGDPGLDPDNIPASLKALFDSRTDDELMEALRAVADASEGAIDLALLPDESSGCLRPPVRTEPAPPVCRKFSGHIDTSWKISSFSSLTAGRSPEETDLPDRDDARDSEPGTQAPDMPAARDPISIAAFPKGAHAGIFFHSIFEHLDFTSGDPGHADALVREKLTQGGFDPIWTDAVCRMIRQVLSVPLLTGRSDFTLSVIPDSDRINEMEFYFPIRSVSARMLSRIFRDKGNGLVPGEFPEQIGKLTFSPCRGFMKGFVDMIFGFDGRYYLVDWKSNVLGADISDYRQEHLAGAMARHAYILQYCLYSLALHQYLRNRVPGYRYESHFGGVFYVFIRGVDSRMGPDSGIYHALPPAGLIEALGTSLMHGFEMS